MQELAFMSQGGSVGSIGEDVRQYPKIRQLLASLQKEELPIFMLANQLPLLQLGRDDPEVTGQIKEHCTKEGPNYHKRLFKELEIVAFSDPNDVLSYEITPVFAHKRMDSRICPKMTNVSINIAEVISLFGVGDIASPGEAHNGYSGDDRVIQLIVHGIGHEGAADLIKERCTWLEIVDQ
jgi:transcription termination factor Rho